MGLCQERLRVDVIHMLRSLPPILASPSFLLVLWSLVSNQGFGREGWDTKMGVGNKKWEIIMGMAKIFRLALLAYNYLLLTISL